VARIAEFGKIARGHRLRLTRPVRIDQQGRQDARQPRQRQCRFGGALMVDVFGHERALHRPVEVLCRIGQHPRGGQREGLGAPDQHWRFWHGSLALVGQLERHRAGGRNQQARGSGAGGKAGFRRQEAQDAIDLDRPAVAQGIQRQGDAAGRPQRANSVISGTWSLGCSQRRVSSTNRWLTDCAARSGEAHM
jgi:hypothetical protein